MREIIPFSDEVKKVLRGTAPSILREYFDGRKLFQDVDFAKEAEIGVGKFVTLMFEKIQSLQPEKLREEVRGDLHSVMLPKNPLKFKRVFKQNFQLKFGLNFA